MHITSTTYRPDIDGLRAIAVLVVVLHHLAPHAMPGGYVGVDVFFVISGYLITRIVQGEIGRGTFSFASFYERRARRIFPALFAVLIAVLAAGYVVLLPSDYVATLRAALGTLAFVSNVVFWHDLKAGYFGATDAALNPLLHMWSLAVEEQFYVLFPLALLACHRYLRRHLFLVLAICAVVSLGLAQWLLGPRPVEVFFLAPFRAWELLAGALLALRMAKPQASRTLREALAAGGLLAIGWSAIVYDAHTAFPGLTALPAVIGTAAIIHAGSGGSTWTTRLLQVRPLVLVGLVSYSLYLWHWPLIVLTRYALGPDAFASQSWVLFGLSLLLAGLSYRYIEKPFRQRGPVRTRWIAPGSLVLASALAGVAVLGLSRDGFSSRFSPQVIALDAARWPDIPFLQCDGEDAESWCRLGAPGVPETILFWGDSHALALAPAVDRVNTAAMRGVAFANRSGCPPLFDASRIDYAACVVHNASVKRYLLANPQVRTVILMAHWNLYFAPESRTTHLVDGRHAQGEEAAARAFGLTIAWLEQQGRDVVVIAPVPQYVASVPLVMALQAAGRRGAQRSDVAVQRAMQAPYLAAQHAEIARGSRQLVFLDPTAWLCAPDCVYSLDGQPLYRDDNHLNVAGAMALREPLTAGLSGARPGAGVALPGWSLMPAAPASP